MCLIMWTNRHQSSFQRDQHGLIHDGFATIRRAPRISRPKITENHLEPVYEDTAMVPFQPRLDTPWWEIATRKSRCYSCTDLEKAHVVSAFEKSLSNMTVRLQQLTATAEKKDSELTELRQTIDALRKQGSSIMLANDLSSTINNAVPISTQHNSTVRSPSLTRRHTINSTIDSSQNNNIARQLSTDSVSSLASLSSACSLSSGNQHMDLSSIDKCKKKRGWLRSSFSKAFSRSKKNRNGSVSDIEDTRTTHSDMSAPSSPLLNCPHQMNGDGSDYHPSNQHMKNSHSSSALYNNTSNGVNNASEEDDTVHELKKQLREKDLVLTDIRLEALSSAHQLESLKDTVIRMRNEMLNLKQDNERLQKIVTNKSLTSSRTSLHSYDTSDRRYSTPDIPVSSATDDVQEDIDEDSKKVAVWVYFGSHGSYHKYAEERNECAISTIPVRTTTNWQSLDSLISRAFKEYLDRIDPETNLGLGAESIWSYHVGEIVRYKDSAEPDLLPCGYLIGGNATTITVCLKGALHSGCLDALSFEVLIPKSIIQRYLSLLTEHHRIMLCGPSGTGKSFLANKLAEFLVYRNGKDITADSVVTFNVDEKSSKDLRQYLSNIAEQCENNSSTELPTVIILDNLHQASSLNEIFNGLLNTKLNKVRPYIIGTMNQATCSTTNLQLHHNFRWVLCANHMEPVKGFLNRYLRRKLIESQCKLGTKNHHLTKIVEWIPKVQQYLNQFLETHSSSEVTIGPKLFMSCPMEVDGSQVWFTDLWNYSLVPYLLDAMRDGLQLYGKRAPWQDPSQYIIKNYPWKKSTTHHGGIETLIRLRPEDVGYETQNESDPLLNMLMTLQEAANYSSSTHSNDSDSINVKDKCMDSPL